MTKKKTTIKKLLDGSSEMTDMLNELDLERFNTDACIVIMHKNNGDVTYIKFGDIYLIKGMVESVREEL